MEEIIYKKIDMKDLETFSHLEELLQPVKDYVEEKKINEMYDDYNEYENTKNGLKIEKM